MAVSNILTVKTAGTGLPTPSPTPAPTPSPTPAPTATPTGPSLSVAPVGYQPPEVVSYQTVAPGMQTLLLDTQRWDLVLDANRNIALGSPPYATAQDAASAIRLFRGEAWYNTALGVPYFQQILGKAPPLGVLKNAFVSAAETVPGVASAVCYVSSVANRGVIGQVQITTVAGTKIAVSGKIQSYSSMTDSSGNPMTDSSGNLMFTVL
jgi:hypothetical protein